MAERVTIAEKKLYKVEFIPTGSTMLDLALGGGWALGRFFNIVGDKSSGKTLLAIEAFANFKQKYACGAMRYAEAEAAFDDEYAKTLGFPEEVKKPDEPLETAEQFEKDLARFLEGQEKKDIKQGLYILDSLDALSDDAEMAKFAKTLKAKDKPEGEDGEKAEKVAGSYGVGKPKEMSKMFRMLTRDIERSQVGLGIISQIRDNIGVTFGESKTRSGGHALDFYASQIVWLHEIEKLKRQVRGQERVVGVRVLANVKKNKVGMPFRRCEFDIIFGYGVDDEVSMIKFLVKTQVFERKTADDWKAQLAKARENQQYKYIAEEIKKPLVKLVTDEWMATEEALKPPASKYPSVLDQMADENRRS